MTSATAVAPKTQTAPVTPHESYPELAAAITGIDHLYLKREDLHPLGSHKGRSISIMIDKGLADGIRSFVISSSGNAALAAALYIKQLNDIEAAQAEPITLDIFIGLKIAPHKRAKLEALKSEHIRVNSHERPLQALFTRTQDPTMRGLRQSNDDVALIGYESLAEELMAIPDLRAVFVGASSGTTAQALAEYFLAHNGKNGKARAPIEVHIVQTSSCHPMSDAFNEDIVTADGGGETSIADAIVDHTAIRRTKLIPLIEKTGGSGWIATNESIEIAQELVRQHTPIKISTNSALSIVGLMNAIYTGRSWSGSIACLTCGE
ncbi:MAG: hypothetical protein JWO73_711 [Candidatus Taylorbacteria bacterium]|nr:hypothetical protein [Candidatus Taylorbacteria bacterium]